MSVGEVVIACVVAMIALASFVCGMLDLLLLSSWRSGALMIVVSIASLSILLWMLVV